MCIKKGPNRQFRVSRVSRASCSARIPRPRRRLLLQAVGLPEPSPGHLSSVASWRRRNAMGQGRPKKDSFFFAHSRGVAPGFLPRPLQGRGPIQPYTQGAAGKVTPYLLILPLLLRLALLVPPALLLPLVGAHLRPPVDRPFRESEESAKPGVLFGYDPSGTSGAL